MRPIPKKLRDNMAKDPYYRKCARLSDGGCSGRITREHVWLYAGRQIQEEFAIIPLCWHHHLGSGLDKEKNKYISIKRATEEDFAKYPKMTPSWHQQKHYLLEKYEHNQLH